MDVAEVQAPPVGFFPNDAESSPQSRRQGVHEPYAGGTSRAARARAESDGGDQLNAQLFQIRGHMAQERASPQVASQPAWQPDRQLGHQRSSEATNGDARLGTAGRERDQLMAEPAQIRAEVAERVDRRPLFTMAQQRRVPYFQLFFMTKQELFEAVLEAEDLPPHDVIPSQQSAHRVRAIAAEAFRLQEEIGAHHLTNDQTA